MVVVDFCSTNNTFECFVESALGIVPVAGFIFFGYYSYKETRARTAYLRQAYTFRHLSKIILSGLLALLSLVFIAIYTILEPEISLKTELTYGVTCILWLLNTYLLRSEYKTLGFTTNYLRYAWITMFVCQTALLIFAAAGANTDSFEKVAAVYIINDISILGIIIVGYSYPDDFPKTRVHEAYGTVLSDSIIDVDEEHFKNLTTPLDRPTRTKEDAAFKPFAADMPEQQKDLPVRKSEGSFKSDNSNEGDDRKLRKGEKKNGSKLLMGSSMTVNLREDIRLIESIEVKGFEEIRRFDKPTIVYTINYVIKGQQFSTKRSYSEFIELRQEAKKEAGDNSLPKIPGKKKIGKTRDEESLGHRAEAFDKLLKVIVREKIVLNHLAAFLMSQSVLPYYGKGKKATEETRKDVNKASMSSTKSDKNEKNQVKTKVLDAQGGRVIADYTQSEANRNQNVTIDLKYFVVETLSTYEEDGSTYYKFNIREKDSGLEYNIGKRYSDFKDFHSDLKKSVKGDDKKSIPELPYKDNVKGFAWRDNPKVIEFRKVALKTYLQNILNNDRFQNNAVVKNFVAPSNV